MSETGLAAVLAEKEEDSHAGNAEEEEDEMLGGRCGTGCWHQDTPTLKLAIPMWLRNAKRWIRRSRVRSMVAM